MYACTCFVSVSTCLRWDDDDNADAMVTEAMTGMTMMM